MPKFVNVSGVELDVYKPAGDGGSVRVRPDQVLEVAGDVEEADDAYIVTSTGDPAAYPKALWQLKDTKTPGKAKAEPVDEGK